MKYLKIFVIMLFCVFIVTGCGNKKENNQQPKEETKTPETKTVQADSFEFTTNSVNFENNNSVFDINIKNIASEERYINEFLIHVKDSAGTELAILYGYVNETIEAGGERVISCSYGSSLSNYASLDFEVTE